LNYKHCNNIIIISQISNYKRSQLQLQAGGLAIQTLAPQQHSNQSVTTLGIEGGTRASGDGSSSVATLTVGHGSRGGSTWPSWVTSVKQIHRGRECGANVAHGATHPVVATLPSIEPSQEDGSGGRRRMTVTATSSVSDTSGGIW
jgi:hypothetical protein